MKNRIILNMVHGQATSPETVTDFRWDEELAPDCKSATLLITLLSSTDIYLLIAQLSPRRKQLIYVLFGCKFLVLLPAGVGVALL